MAEPFDEYVDQVIYTAGPFGVNLAFERTPRRPPAPGSAPVNDPVGTIRMSLEHLKVLVFVLKTQIDQVESNEHIAIPISTRVLNCLRIAPEDWDTFWTRRG